MLITTLVVSVMVCFMTELGAVRLEWCSGCKIKHNLGLLYVMREIVIKLTPSDTGTSLLWGFCNNVRHLYVVTFGE